MRFDIALVGQAGRIGVEAALLAASLRRADSGFSGRLTVMEPTGPLWERDPAMGAEARAGLDRCGAEIVRFENRVFGEAYPHGNKIEGLAATMRGPTLFLDSDTLVLGPLSGLSFDHPTASMRRSGSWPRPGTERGTWHALYDRFGIDIGPTLDAGWPEKDWRRYLYLNAGWVFLPAAEVAETWLDVAARIWREPGAALEGQALTPWLDQIALPLALVSHGGARPGPKLDGLDGALTCHWRTLPLLYAREEDQAVETLETLAALPWLKKALRTEPAFRRMVYQGHGRRARALYGPGRAPGDEAVLRKGLKAAGLWIR